METESHTILLDRSGLRTIPNSRLLRLRRSLIAFDRLPLVGNTAVQFHNLFNRLFDIDLTRYGEDDVGRAIVFLHIGNDIVTSQRAQTFRSADAPTPHPVFLECG